MEFENLFEKLQSLVAEVLDGKAEASGITPETTMDQLNLDSLDMATLLVAVEQDFGVELEDVSVGSNPTMRDLVALIQANLDPDR